MTDPPDPTPDGNRSGRPVPTIGAGTALLIGVGSLVGGGLIIGWRAEQGLEHDHALLVAVIVGGVLGAAVAMICFRWAADRYARGVSRPASQQSIRIGTATGLIATFLLLNLPFLVQIAALTFCFVSFGVLMSLAGVWLATAGPQRRL